MSHAKAISELKNGLDKFKKDAMSKGWQEDEVDEKVAEVFENFPWYKYSKKKTSWKSRIANFLLYSFIAYLSFNALYERSKTFSFMYNSFTFDYQVAYHQQRFVRFLTLPLHRFVDMSKYHDSECIIENPLYKEEELDCAFCEGLEEVSSLSVDHKDLQTVFAQGEPVILRDVPHYHNITTGFNDLKKMFDQHHKELDKAICEVKSETGIKKASDFFKLTEEQVIKDKINFSWTNCHTYGTRFYRQIFPRPSFISADKEVYMEKKVFFLHKDQEIINPDVNQEGSTVIVQVQGESKFTMSVPQDCSHNCTTDHLPVQLNKGDIVVFSSNGWLSNLIATSEDLSIVYLSKFSR